MERSVLSNRLISSNFVIDARWASSRFTNPDKREMSWLVLKTCRNCQALTSSSQSKVDAIPRCTLAHQQMTQPTHWQDEPLQGRSRYAPSSPP